MKKLQKYLELFDLAVKEFIITASKIDPDFVVYKEGLTKKDIVAHVTVWHEYYAEVLTALVNKLPPRLYNKSTPLVNKIWLDKYKGVSLNTIIKNLEEANNIILKNIVKIKGVIPYSEKGRRYIPWKYVSAIAGHIKGHTKDLKRIKIRKP